MKIAIITGASSGMGREFARQIPRDYPWLDEIWMIARNEKKLEQGKQMLEVRSLPGTLKLRILALDLTSEEDRKSLADKLCEEKPRIKLLVNAAGMGVIGRAAAIPVQPQLETVRTNCEALTAVTLLCLPYLRQGSRIIQMSSASAFAPQPGFAVYAATKSYVMSFSRALRQELKEKGITVTCVCPGPVDTPFFDQAEKYQRRLPAKRQLMAAPDRVVAKAIRDAASGRELSVYGVPMKLAFGACRILPHSVVIRLMDAMEQQ